jgi:hypothetical protein
MIANYTVGGYKLFIPNTGPGSIAETQIVSSQFQAVMAIRTC